MPKPPQLFPSLDQFPGEESRCVTRREEHRMKVDKFLMLNAAIPAEAFDESQHDTSVSDNPMVPNAWEEHGSRNWSAEWHANFLTKDSAGRLVLDSEGRPIPSDDRGRLT